MIRESFLELDRRASLRARLLRSTFVSRVLGGPAMFDVQTINTVAPEPKPEELLERMVAAIEELKTMDVLPSVIVVADDVPNGLEVRAGEICFMTLSTAGLERIKADVVASGRLLVHSEDSAITTLQGLPIVRLFDLMTSDNPRARKLAQYYAAAIQGARSGQGL